MAAYNTVLDRHTMDPADRSAKELQHGSEDSRLQPVTSREQRSTADAVMPFIGPKFQPKSEH